MRKTILAVMAVLTLGAIGAAAAAQPHRLSISRSSTPPTPHTYSA